MGDYVDRWHICAPTRESAMVPVLRTRCHGGGSGQVTADARSIAAMAQADQDQVMALLERSGPTAGVARCWSAWRPGGLAGDAGGVRLSTLPQQSIKQGA